MMGRIEGPADLCSRAVCGKISQVLAKQITVCISPALGKRVRKRALAKGCSQSEIVRDALENYLGSILMRGFAYELALAAGLIGRLQGVPIDLSSNRKYLKGFGKQR